MTSKAFLKKYSAVPNSFIDELFEMYDENTPDTQPSINLNNVCSWLELTKKGLMKTLKESYVLGIDYTVEKPINPIKKTPKSNNMKLVLLTPDCFKRLCMQSHSKRAGEVRTYFINIERLLFKYRADLEQGLKARIEELTRNMKSKSQQKTSRQGFIYVLKASSTVDSVYKIGRTTNLSHRLTNYNSGRADDIDVIFQYETDDIDEVEACVKALLKKNQYRKYKEVYEADIDMIKGFISGCSQLKMNYRKPKPSKMSGGYYIALI